MTFQELQEQYWQLTAAIRQLQTEGTVLVHPPLGLDNRSQAQTNQTDYRKQGWDAAGREQRTPLSAAEDDGTEAAIARGQKLQALEQAKQQVAAAIEQLTTFALQHGLLLPKQKSHDCKVQHSSDSNEWYTPAFWVSLARLLMGGIDLDPASSAEAQSWIQAANYYTREDDGLQQPWWGRLWLNPPYGKCNHAKGIYGATAWVQRAIAAYEAGQVTQAVLWLRASGNAGIRALEQAGFPRVTLGRIPHAPPGANGVPQKAVGHDTVVWYLGPHTERFHTLFVPPISGAIRSLNACVQVDYQMSTTYQ
ncbi:MAG: DNA N-6-adenine-methyltransferase (plasmid) [Leptolyngbya sp. BL-A-14]